MISRAEPFNKVFVQCWETLVHLVASAQAHEISDSFKPRRTFLVFARKSVEYYEKRAHLDGRMITI